MSVTTAGRAESASILRGVLFILGTALCFSVSDAIAKYLREDHPIVMVMWARYLFQTAIMALVLFPRRPLELIRTARPVLQVARSLLNLFSSFVFIFALAWVPLAEATALGFVAPLMVTALSVPILGEKVGPRRWTAVAVGFLGAMVILRPGFETFHWAALLILSCAFMYALFQVWTRVLSAHDRPMVTMAYTTVGGLLALSALVPFFWAEMPWQVWALLAAQGLFGGLAHYFLIRAYENAPVSVVQPFQYIQIVFATLIGLLAFAELPDLVTYLGTGIVVASGLYIIFREAHMIRARRG